MNGKLAYSKCKTQPLEWALNSQNPYDYTNFMYVDSGNHHYVEDMSSYKNSNPDFPYGDRYMGVVTKECEPKHMNKTKTGCDMIEYNVMHKDEGGFTVGPFACMSASGNDNGYGPCNHCTVDPNSCYHYFLVRDWDAVMDKHDGGEAYCCVMPSQSSFDKDDPWVKDLKDKKNCIGFHKTTRTVKCPQTHHKASPICVPIVQTACSNPDEWKTKRVPSTEDPTKKVSVCDTYTMPFNGVPNDWKRQVLVRGIIEWGKKLKGDVPTDDELISMFSKKCSENIGVCDLALKDLCTNVTMSDIKKNPSLGKLCGCFLQDKEYTLPGIIPVECNGACNMNNIIKNGVLRGEYDTKTNNFEPLQCKQTTCVMDDITVDIINSQVDEDIDFSQLCGGCKKGSNCTCIMSNITIEELNSKFKGKINFDQNCGSCSDGKTQTDCKVGNKKEFFKPTKRTSAMSDTVLIIFLAIVIITLLWLSIKCGNGSLWNTR